MTKRRFKFRAAEYGHIDCPNCGECDDRNLGENRCGLCECRFVIRSYSTKAKWLWVGDDLTRIDPAPGSAANG
jgi:hypothetical protein